MKFYTQTLDILKTTSEFLCLKMTQLWMLQVAWGFTNEDYGVAPMVPDSTVAQSTLHRCQKISARSGDFLKWGQPCPNLVTLVIFSYFSSFSYFSYFSWVSWVLNHPLWNPHYGKLHENWMELRQLPSTTHPSLAESRSSSLLRPSYLGCTTVAGCRFLG